MEVRRGTAARMSGFVHKHFLGLLLGSYAVAAFAPGPGLWVRDCQLGTVSAFGASTRVSLSMVMLSSLLLNAGLGVRAKQALGVLRRPGLLAAGLAANLLIPIAFILGVTQMMVGWHNADEVQNILVGLALVASMPIAGSSTAWSQNADGDLTLSLGLVLFSTLLSPLTTPLALHAAGLLATGPYAEALHGLAAGGTGGFLAVCVLAPSVAGVALRWGAGDARYEAARPALKLVNSVVLLALNYSNASASLPKALAKPDVDFLVVTLVIVTGLCASAFVSGWGIARALGADPARRTSLMFGLGMNNNGTGLVLASLALGQYPRVMLPIIFYNLVQHLAAGVVDRLNRASAARETAPADATASRPAARTRRADAARVS